MHTLAGEWKSSGETRRIKKMKIQKTPTILRLRSGTAKGNKLRVNPLPKTVKLGSNPLHTEPVLQLTWKIKRIHKRHGTTTSKYRRTHPICMEAVFSMVRKICGRQLGDPMKGLNVNWAIWGMFMNTTLRAAVHLGKENDMNSRFVKNHLWKTAGQLSTETENELINIPLPRSMSSPTLCSVWEKWETILFIPGRSKSNGNRITIISAD